MDRSYIHVGAIEEYFGHTLVHMPALGDHPVWLSSFECSCCDEEEDGYFCTFHVRAVDGAHSLEYELRCYDDVFDHIIPWLPASLYLDEVHHGDFKRSAFVQCWNPNHYKRSLNEHRYRANRQFISRTGVVAQGECGIEFHKPNRFKIPDRTLAEAMETDTFATGEVVALSESLAVGMASRMACIYLLFRGTPIGIVNERMFIELHPKYADHFSYVSKEVKLS